MKLEMMPGHIALKHLLAFPNSVIRKYAQMKWLSIDSDVIVHQAVSMCSLMSVFPSYLGKFGIIVECWMLL